MAPHKKRSTVHVLVIVGHVAPPKKLVLLLLMVDPRVQPEMLALILLVIDLVGGDEMFISFSFLLIGIAQKS